MWLLERLRVSRACVLTFICLAAVGGTANAQAWIPPAGTGNVAITYQYMNGGDHLFPTDAIDGLRSRGYVAEGNRWFLGESIAHSATASLDYGLLSHVAISGSLVWVRARYEGRSIISPSTDDGFFHGGFQDWSATVRVAAVQRPLALTPFLGYSAPTRAYPAGGHASIGAALDEVRIGLHAGRNLSPLWRRGYAQATYSYGFVEDPEDIPIDRRRYELEVGWFATLRLTLWGSVRRLDTVGGEEWANDDLSGSHSSTSLVNSQLGAARSTMVGGGASYVLRRRLTLFADVQAVARGENIEDAVFVAAGVSISFEAPWRNRHRAAR